MAKLKPKISRRPDDIEPGLWRWLCGERVRVDDEETVMEIYVLSAGDGSALRELWGRTCSRVLAEFIASAPGRRPPLWWQYDAPGPRRFVSGAGAPAHLVLAYAEEYRCGLPTCWVGLKAGDLPTYESESSYLRRHALLTPDEAVQLTHKDYAPVEVICAEAWFCERTGPDLEGVAELRAGDARMRRKIEAARRQLVTQ